MTTASVAQTASDALLAKWSALECGHTPVSSVNNCLVYGDLLRHVAKRQQHCGKAKTFRRQTPLINAGYAARISIMTHIVARWIKAHNKNVMFDDDSEQKQQQQQQQQSPLNVVMLGGGLDVLGIWAYSLLPSAVTVLELDCAENCKLKTKVLQESGILKPNRQHKKETEEVKDIYRATIDLSSFLSVSNCSPNNKDDTNAERINYYSAAVDLRDTASVRSIVEELLDLSKPTLVISELVLAYLGHSGMEQVLNLCANSICRRCPGSGLVAYEPIGEQKIPENPLVCPSVLKSFRAEYCKKFSEKLERGTTQETTSFTPLGTGCREVRRFLSESGFYEVDCCVAGVGAVWASKDNPHDTLVNCPELFDEHASLALHLQCYAVVCAFSPGTDPNLIQSTCPWFTVRADICIPEKISLCSKEVILDSIKPLDEEQVRKLFTETYQNLVEYYPSVRKMVKSALKSDLSAKTHHSGSQQSAIGRRYADWGGRFIVARVEEDTSGTVLGCIGVRPCRTNGSKRLFEVLRLLVDTEHQGKGLATALLTSVERFVKTNQDARGDDVELLATTPALLEAANRFYESSGFVVIREGTMGRMQIRTYSKKL